MKCAVIIHIFYYDIADELAEAVKNICDVEKDIFLTVSESIRDRTDEIAKKFPSARINIVKNVGYDIWPFLFILNQLELDQYDLIVKLHTKRNMPEATFLKKTHIPYSLWRRKLLGFTDTKDAFRMSLQILEKKNIGVVLGSGCLLNEQYDDSKQLYSFIKKLMNELLLSYDSRFQFVAGCMFVGKAFLFQYLQNRFAEKDFREADRLHKKEELPHVLERILGYIVGTQGYDLVNHNEKDVNYEACLANLKYFLYRKKYTSGHVITRVFGVPVFIRKFHGIMRK